MKRLSRKEIYVCLIACALTLLGILGAALSIYSLAIVSVCLLIITLFFLIILLILRVERLSGQHKKARKEIYQVLYSLHGAEKLVEQLTNETQHALTADMREMLQANNSLIEREGRRTRVHINERLQARDGVLQKEARNTRDHISNSLEQHADKYLQMQREAVHSELDVSATQAALAKLGEVEESQRLQFAKIVAILDAHWELMDEIQGFTTPYGDGMPGVNGV